jgi:hypothetical protein
MLTEGMTAIEIVQDFDFEKTEYFVVKEIRSDQMMSLMVKCRSRFLGG